MFNTKMKYCLCLAIILCVFAYVITAFKGNPGKKRRPNIVIIMADDMGINDVSYHGSNQILTPNIDALAYQGIILKNFYTQCLCTPSRSALLTGKYPVHTGMQQYVIASPEPWGLPLDEKIMPQYFKDAGYQTHLIGKWHQGFFQKAYTPTQRGFDTHLGYLGSHIDYYDHTQYVSLFPFPKGYDFRKNLDVTSEGNGTYATDIFNQEAVRIISRKNESDEPLFLLLSHLAPHAGNENEYWQAPQDEIDRFQYISDVRRRKYAAMMAKLDEGVGMVVEALCNNKMLDNTIILFYSDNGAPTVGLYQTTGSNYPLKGQKNSPWEGGSRAAAFIWSRLIKNQKRVSDQLIHITDWLPTLAAAAGIQIPNKNQLDGFNRWHEISSNLRSNQRNSILLNMDPAGPYEAYRRGKWKLVNGTSLNGIYDTWLGQLNDEIDPRSNDYADIILNSKVGKIFNQRSSDVKLTKKNVNLLRKEAILTCPDHSGGDNLEVIDCEPLEAPCLFNLEDDPCERNNLASVYPEVLAKLQNDLQKYHLSALPPRVKPWDPLSNPALHNYTWTWWL